MSSSGKNGFLARLSHPVALTEGTPWRVILRYAAPIILSYLLQQIYTLTDAIICGQVLPSQQIAGVNDIWPLTFIFLQFAFGCTAGFSVLTGNSAGRGDTRGVRRSFCAQVWLSLVISAVLTVLSIVLLPQMLGFIEVTPDNPVIYQAAYDYCFYIFLGTAAQMGYNFICGVLRAYGDSVTPLLFLLISTVLNIALDLFFLVTLRMGPAGAAIATVLAQLLSCIGCVIYTFLRYPELRPTRDDWKLRGAILSAHFRQGFPLGLQFSVLAIGVIIMQAAIVRFDLSPDGVMIPSAPVQNGSGAASKLHNFLSVFFNGLGAAILGFNAQNFGKGDYERVRRGTLQTLLLMMIFYVVTLSVSLVLSVDGAYQYVFMSADKVTAESILYGNRFLYITQFLSFILGYLLVVRSAVQGIGGSAYVLGAGVAELAARCLICGLLAPMLNGGAINTNASLGIFTVVSLGHPGAWLAAALVLTVPLLRQIIGKRYRLRP